MEKKYYDLIISLIKNHRKYNGYEAILEDIANDVFEHAKVVLSSVDNEEVVTAYLNKVVTTSIITVPKKLNFNRQTTPRIVPDILEQVNEIDTSSSNCEIIVDEEHESLSINENCELKEQELILDEVKTQQDIELELEEEEEEEPSDIIQNTFVQDEIADKITNSDTEIEQVSEEPSEPLNTELQDVDVSLVDKMINGINDDSITNEANESYVEDNEYENINEIEVQDDSIEDTNLNILESDIQSEENIDNRNFELELTSDNEFNNELDLSGEGESLELKEESAIPEFLPEEESADTIETVENDIPLEENLSDNNNVTDFIVPSFDCFEYNPQNIKDDIDVETIISTIDKLDKKYPEYQILNICQLKYEQNLSIAQIAEQTGFTEENVLDVLNQIVDAIKD